MDRTGETCHVTIRVGAGESPAVIMRLASLGKSWPDNMLAGAVRYKL